MKETIKEFFFFLKNKLVFLKNKFISQNLTLNFRMIFLTRITINSATQLMGLFLPIFLYEFLGMNLQLVLLYYLLNDLLFFGNVSLGCRYIMNKIGINRSLQVSIFLGALYYVFFFFINQYVLSDYNIFSFSNLWWLLPTLFCSLFFRLSHWVPYHVSITKLTDQNIRASQFSLLEAAILTLGAIIPVIAGLILDFFGYSYLFLTAITIYFIALIFIKRLPKVKESYSWTYRKTWSKFFSKEMRTNVLAYIGEGAESFAKIIIWPIFIWQILEGNYLQVGLITSIIILSTILIQLSLGNILNKSRNRNIWLKYSSFFHSLAWLLKSIIVNPLQIFLFSTYYNISSIFVRTSFSILHYDIASKRGHYVDEYSVLREKGVILGRITMALLSIIILYFLPIRFIFILTAFFALLVSLLKNRKDF
jgi:hypothetical protein